MVDGQPKMWRKSAEKRARALNVPLSINGTRGTDTSTGSGMWP